MRQIFRSIGVLGPVAAAALVLIACGSSRPSNSGPSAGSGARQGGSVTVLMGTAPDSLDPQFSVTTQGAEALWISYTPLLTYRRANGTPGTAVIPGLANALPRIAPDGKTYTLTLRRGLVYSNGTPVRAADFGYTVQRAIRLSWGGKSFLTKYVVGAGAFDRGAARAISGITTNNATGQITIRLAQPYGAFANVLAFPALGLVPTGTPLTNLPNSPPPGVGPYEISSVTPNRTFTLVRNPNWARNHIPGIPPGHLGRIVVNIATNTQQEAEQVLNGQADVFDAGDEVPGSLLGQIKSRAPGRFAEVPTPQNFFFFLNVRTPPFNNLLARQAVNYALDRRALQRLAGGALTPACFFVPAGVIGHPTSAACPYGDPTAAPNVAKARALIRQAGLTGTAVTVWGQNRSPRKEYVDYYTSVLNQIGLRATEKIIASATYFDTIGNSKTPNLQTGFADWQQDFPNPSDFYLLLDAKAIQPVKNQNWGLVDDPHIQSELAVLNRVPTTRLATVAARWQALEEYVARKAYVAVYGYAESPKFFSSRIDFGSALFHPLFFNDWSSWKLK